MNYLTVQTGSTEGNCDIWLKIVQKAVRLSGNEDFQFWFVSWVKLVFP